MEEKKVNFLQERSSENRGFTLRISDGSAGGIEARLGIPQKGHRPAVCEAGSVVLICAGHVYAKRAPTFDLSSSLALLAEDYRSSGLQGLRQAIGGGMYALIVLDRDRGTLYGIADLFSCMPLYYRAVSGGLLLGSSQYDLSSGTSPDPDSCAEYLAYGYLLFRESLYKGVSRLLPGQVLSLDFGDPGRPRVSELTLPAFPPLNERVTREEEGVELVDSLFTKYFNRLGGERIAAGLSGGYDSRLIAAYCRDKRISLVTFDNPRTGESQQARAVAQALGLTTRVIDIPPDAPSRFAEDLVYGTGTADSLESAHMYANLAALLESDPQYVIDGHIGDVVLGGGWYSALSHPREPLWKVLTGTDRYLAPPASDETYIDWLKTAKGRRLRGLGNAVDEALDASFRDSLRSMLSAARPYCVTDADLTELLLHRFRGAALTTGGPVSFLRRVPTLMPFYDLEILTACMGISKNLRSRDRLYNAFYRRRFPEIARLPKENTGGWAAQSMTAYRLTHLGTAVGRKLSSKLPSWLKAGAVAGGNLDDFQQAYFADPANRSFFDGTARRTAQLLSDIGIPAAGEHEASLSPLMHIRRVSLGLLLGDIL